MKRRNRRYDEKYFILEKNSNAVILKRDKGVCQICGRKAWEIHEIIPRRMFGNDYETLFSEKNRMMVCRECHTRYGNQKGKLLQIMKNKYNYNYSEEPFKFFMEETNG